jgi:tRNA (guanine37-N1)-methyltransferase
MRNRSRYIKIEKIAANNLIQILKKELHNDIKLDDKRKVLYEGNYVLFPIHQNSLKNKQIKQILNNQFEYQIIIRNSIPRINSKTRSLNTVLSAELPNKLKKWIPQSYDIIGDIAVIEFEQNNLLPKEKYDKLKKLVAEKLISINKSILKVFEKVSEVKGLYRLRDFKILSGEDKSETIHKENKCKFKLDIKKTYFSPRLGFERKRISSLDYKESEKIIDLFAGVGPFSIQIAKNHNVLVNAFDVNPDAYNYLLENLKINKLKGTIIPYQRDVLELLNPTDELGLTLKNQADRIIMNLPEKSLEYIRVACYLMCDSGGIIHIYQFSEKPNSIKKSIQNANSELTKNGWQIEKIMNAKVVKPFSPKADLIILDLHIKKV